ncbi:MAG: sulfite exporter TauE/SafE family protein [Actinomycetota bacterium]
MPADRRALYVAVGMAGGMAGGLLGVGGGVVMVPALVLGLRFAQRRAHAASLSAILPIGVVSTVLYLCDGNVNGAIAVPLALGSVMGVPMGVRLLARVPESALRATFVATAVLAGVKLLFQFGSGAEFVVLTGAARFAVAFGVGLLAGVYAGLLGVGGGIVMVPAMTILLGQAQHIAQGTSLLVIIATASAGTAANLRRGLLDVRVGAWLGVGGAVGAVIGALLARSIPEAALGRAFGAFVILVAIQLLLSPGRARAPDRTG